MERRGFLAGLVAAPAAVAGWGTAKAVTVARSVMRDRLVGIAGENLRAGDAVTLDKSGLIFRMTGSRYTHEERVQLIDPTER